MTGPPAGQEPFAGSLAAMAMRRLSEVMPPLAEHVRPGDRVLDVGCGPGSITLDVARLAPGPSKVTGVDQSPMMIDAAQRAATSAGIRNAKFVIGDAQRLAFADGAFDLTYSNALLDWLEDPVAALREQARVTRRGGIVFARLSDLSSQTFHPPCPDVTRVVGALHALASTDPGQAGWNPFLGTRAVELLRGAGLDVVNVLPWSTCFSSAQPDVNRHLVSGLLLAGVEPPYSAAVRALLERGLTDTQLLTRASGQLRTLISNPCGLSIRSGVHAIGKVP